MMSKTSRAKVQAFGGFLTAMVIPNMGAFMAWGFLTAFFIPTGWFPHEGFGSMVGPMVSYLLPLLLAYTGGKLIGGERGGIAGTIGTFGLIIGADIPMFLGAMVMGPLSALVVKKFDQMIDSKIPVGFEMVVNNFSLGIIGLLLCLCSYSFIGPLILQANKLVTVMIEALVKTGWLPLLSLVNEPAKVLFLNNVIDQGIYYPLGMQDALNTGKSIYFMVASNPGSGLGLLLAYSFFGQGNSKKTAPGAIIIHFFGGIHEIYFPYVLMKPVLILSMILGGATGTLVFSLFGSGLTAGPSPGSIFSYLLLTPKGNFLGVIAGVLAAAVVSFLVTTVILKNSKQIESEDLEDAIEKSKAMKAEGKSILAAKIGTDGRPDAIKFVAFACDAGLGSSAMGANAFRKRLQKENIELIVKNFAIEKVPQDADIIVTHSSLLERTRMSWPDMRVVAIENFMKDPEIDILFEEIMLQKSQGQE